MTDLPKEVTLQNELTNAVEVRPVIGLSGTELSISWGMDTRYIALSSGRLKGGPRARPWVLASADLDIARKVQKERAPKKPSAA